MSRKPVHLVAAAKFPGTRQAMWQAIRALRRFTLAEVAAETNADIGTARTYVRSLELGGYLQVTGQGEARNFSYEAGNPALKRPNIYELVRDVGAEAPRVKRDGSPCVQGAPREQMWRTMKILATFTPRELALAASTEEHPVADTDARDYLKHLAKSGYVQVVEPAKATIRQARYRFVRSRNTGPLAPQIQRLKTVFDPNENRIAWHEEPAE